MKKQELLNIVQRLPDDGRSFAWAIWEREDVINQAMENNIEITPEEADAVIEAMDHHHDSSLGLSWVVLAVHLKEVVHARKPRGQAGGETAD
jgi:hypothetical protein